MQCISECVTTSKGDEIAFMVSSLHKRLEKLLEKSTILPPSQYNFRKSVNIARCFLIERSKHKNITQGGFSYLFYRLGKTLIFF